MTAFNRETFDPSAFAVPPPPLPAFSLMVSAASDRSNPVALHDQTLKGPAFVFLLPEAGVDQVQFWLDTEEGPPRQTEYDLPFDFAGTTNWVSNPFDTTTVSNGAHRIVALVSAGGETVRVEAVCVVDNAPLPVGNVLKMAGHHYNDGSIKSDLQLAEMNWIVVQPQRLQADPGLVARIRTLNPDGIWTAYFLTPWATTWYLNWTDLDANPSFHLHNPDGLTDLADKSNRVRRTSNTFLMRTLDFRVAALRSYYASHMMDMWVTPHALNGVYHDGPINGFHGLGGWNLAPTAAQTALYRSDNAACPYLTWFTEMTTALASAVTLPHMQVANSTLSWNAGSSYADDTLFLAAGRCEGSVCEGAFHAPWEGVGILQNEVQSIDHCMTQIQRNIDLGKYMMIYSGVSGPRTPAETERWRNFSFAMYLMQADGNLSYFSWTDSAGVGFPNDASITYMKNTAAALGTPMGAYFPVPGTSGHVLQRDFSGGIVLANKSASLTLSGLAPQTATITLV